MGGQDACLLVSRLDQPVADTAVLGALADCIDAGRAGLKTVIDDYAAIDGEIGGAREFGVRSCPGRDHHQVGFDLSSILQHNSLRTLTPRNFQRFRVEMDGDASCLDGALEHVGRAGVELPLHEPVHQMDDRNLDA